ncbi:MAG: porin family protein [Bacteroidota bacterium]
MKFRFLFFFLFVSIAGMQAQSFNGGLLGGISASQISGDGLSGFDKAGIIFGGFTRWDFTEKTAFQMEMAYVQKGSRRNADPNKGSYFWYRLRLDYIDTYFLFKYTIKKVLLEAGPSFGYLIRQQEEGTGISQPRDFFHQDISLNAGLGYKINEKLRFNLRYGETFFMTPVRKKDAESSSFFIRGQYHSVLSFTLQYQF